jgi:hypothetical protein
VPFGGLWPRNTQSPFCISVIIGTSSHRLFVSLDYEYLCIKNHPPIELFVQYYIEPMPQHRLFDCATRTRSRPNSILTRFVIKQKVVGLFVSITY